MSITSDEVNFLVYRYLQESGKKVPPERGASPSTGTCTTSSHHPNSRLEEKSPGRSRSEA